MTIQFACPTCKKALKAPDEKAGAKTTCPGCKTPLQIPSGIAPEIAATQISVSQINSLGPVEKLAVLTLRPLAGFAFTAIGIPGADLLAQGVGQVVDFLADKFKDDSQRLSVALNNANEKAWKMLEIALAGESFWKRLTAKGEDSGFAKQIRVFLDSVANSPDFEGKPDFRQRCIEEIRAARKKGVLTGANYDASELAKQTGAFARYADPVGLIQAEWQFIGQLADALEKEKYKNLASLLRQKPPQGMPLLVIGVRYYFRRAVEEDAKLFQGLAFAKLEALGEAQEKGFAALSDALTQQGKRLEELLSDVQTVVVETHSAVLDVKSDVLDIKAEMRKEKEERRAFYKQVMGALESHQLQHRELRSSDSLSIRNDTERQLVKGLVARYRALPEDQRRNSPALLNALGKLEVVAGDFDAAQKDFQQVATLVSDTTAQADAHFNAYRVALERRDLDTALRELLEAVKLDSKRYAPFPVGKYRPNRILGAGGFGVAFLCKHKDLKANVAVKTITADDLGRDVDEVLNEARVLYQMDHPAIIRVLDCGYTIPGEKARPYFVMTFFEGVSLEEFVEKNGPLSPEDMVAVGRQMAEGLQAAHGKGIWHRDVKPANLLVRKDGNGWQVKLIDFGLALKQSVVEAGASTAKRSKTVSGSSIAGTVDYAAPEQMGKLSGVPVGTYSDIYGFGKTCCYALFKTTHPLPKHWKGLPNHFAELLEKCLEEEPNKRPQTFADILGQLHNPAAGGPLVEGIVVEEPLEVVFPPLPSRGHKEVDEGNRPRRRGRRDDEEDDEEEEKPRRQSGSRKASVLGPGIAMLVVAIPAILFTLLFLVSGAGWQTRQSDRLIPYLLFLSLAHNGAFSFAVFHFFQFKSFRLAIAASFLVMGSWVWVFGHAFKSGDACSGITGLIGSLAGVGIGIWSLVALLRPETRARFSVSPQRNGWAFDSLSHRTKLTVAGSVLGALLVAILVFAFSGNRGGSESKLEGKWVATSGRSEGASLTFSSAGAVIWQNAPTAKTKLSEGSAKCKFNGEMLTFTGSNFGSVRSVTFNAELSSGNELLLSGCSDFGFGRFGHDLEGRWQRVDEMK